MKNTLEYPGDIQVWNELYSNQIQADWLIYGSSRAWVQFNPAILENRFSNSVYNMGIDGHNFPMQYLRHSDYLHLYGKPKLILFSVDFFTFEHRGNLFYQEQFLPFMLWNPKMYVIASQYEGFIFLDYWIPLIRYRGKIKEISKRILTSLRQNGSEFYRKKGFASFESDFNSDFESVKQQMKSYTTHSDSSTIQLFDQFLRECKRDSIPVILIYAPEYIEGQLFVRNRTEVIRRIEQFASLYQIPFWNYSSDSLSFQKKYFFNSMHLNATGADIFTQSVADRLSLWLHQDSINIH